MVNNVSVEVAMQHNDSYSDNTYGFVNNITTPEGGTHVVGFRNAITKTFNAVSYTHLDVYKRQLNDGGQSIMI